MSKSKKLPAALATMLDNLETAQAATPAISDGELCFLKMDKTGGWIYGADEIEVDEDSSFVIDPALHTSGFIAWDDGQLVDEKMAQIGERPISMADLPDVGARWDVQVGFVLRGVEGPEEGMNLTYKVSSRGGKAAIATIINAIRERGREGETQLCPIVALGSDFYKHKKYGKVYTPTLEVLEWVDMPEAEEPKPDPAPEPVAEEPEPAKKPARRRKRAA